MTASVSVFQLDLPSDLTSFLRESHILEYDFLACEAGQVTLCAIESLRLIEIYVNSEETPFEACLRPEEDDEYEYNPDMWDPHCVEGFYAIQAVNLIASVTGYEGFAAGTLLWYPKYRQYGQWDNEHGNAIRFGNISWSDIVADPVHFMNAKWRWDEKEEIFNWVTPWLDPEFDYRPGYDMPHVAKDLGAINPV